MFGNLTGFGAGLLDDFQRLEQQLDQLFGGSDWPISIRSTQQAGFPPVNVGSSSESVDVYLFAAGLDPQSLDLSLQQNLLTITGERQPQHDADAQVFRQERFTGGFRRTIALPEDVDPELVSAHYREGVLHVRVGRSEAARPRRIAVH
jgi:HSP20 family protein